MAFLELVLRPVIAVALVALAILAFLYITQRSMVYFPGSVISSVELLPPGTDTVELHTDDGLRLPAWFLPAAAEPMPDGPEPTPVAIAGASSTAPTERRALTVRSGTLQLRLSMDLRSFRRIAVLCPP